MDIEIVYATTQQPRTKTVRVPAGSTAFDVLQAVKGLYHDIELSDINSLSIGCFGKSITLDTSLQAGDRLEVYAPLRCDPMTLRRFRARKRAL